MPRNGYQYRVEVWVGNQLTDTLHFESFATAERWANNNEIDGIRIYIIKE